MKAINLWKSLMLSAALLTAGAMTSCENETEGGDFKAEISTSLASNTPSVKAGQELEFTVTSNASWTATVEDPDQILTITPTSGKSGKTTVTATFAEGAQNGQKAAVTFSAASNVSGMTFYEKLLVTFYVKGDVVLSDEYMITNANELTAGEYYMAGYGKDGAEGNPDLFAEGPYHLWDGKQVSNDKANLETTNYRYADGVLTKVGTYGDPVLVTLEEGEGNSFYIKYNDQYLSTGDYDKGSLVLGSTKYAWEVSQLSDVEGYSDAVGIMMTGSNGTRFLGTGKAGSAMIRVYNSTNNFQGGLVFFTTKVTLEVEKGEPAETVHAGTADDPYSVADAIAKAKETGATATTDAYYIKGYVKTITENYAAQYGNATFSIVDDLNSNGASFGAYRVLYLNNQKWTDGQAVLSLGDEVILCGKIINYMGNTPQVANNTDGYLYQIVSTGHEVPEPDETPDSVVFESDDIFVCTADVSADGVYTLGANSTFNGKKATGFKLGTGSKVGKFTSGAVGVTGDHTLTLYGGAWNNAPGTLKVSVNGGGSVEGTAEYALAQNAGVKGNAPFTLTVNEGDKYTFQLKGLTATSTITFESVTDAYRVVVAGIHLDGYTGGGTVEPEPEQPGDYKHAGTEADPFSVADAIAKAKETGTTATSETYYISGKITSIKYTYSAQYGTATFDVVDDSSTTPFTAYAIKYFNNEKWVEGNTQINVGDEVVFAGKIVNYGGNTPETAQNSGYLVKLNGDTGNGGGTVEPEPEQPEPGQGGVDVLNNAFTGVGTVTVYTDWSGKTGTSGAVYAGRSAGDSGTIQLRSSGSNEGVVTTASGGKVTKIAVKWNDKTNAARTLDVYAKNSAYSSAADLFNSSNQGTKVATFKMTDGDQEIEINGDYTFIGFRSTSSALYLDEVKITWEK